jgi:hypothetical protein
MPLSTYKKSMNRQYVNYVDGGSMKTTNHKASWDRKSGADYKTLKWSINNTVDQKVTLGWAGPSAKTFASRGRCKGSAYKMD